MAAVTVKPSIVHMATGAKSTRLQAKQLSELSPHDFEEKYCCVLFIEDFTYDVVSVRTVVRNAKSKAKSPGSATVGEVVTVKGFVSKVMQIGSKKACLQEQQKLEKALSVMERQDDSDKNEGNDDEVEDKPISKKRKSNNSQDISVHRAILDESDDEGDKKKMIDAITKEEEKVKKMLKARNSVQIFSQMRNELASQPDNRDEITSLKKHVDQVDQKLDQIMDILKSGNSSSGSSVSTSSWSAENTPERKVNRPKYELSPASLFKTKDATEAVMYNEINLTKGHIPSKPALFATQRLSMLFSEEELETCTIEPSEKSGKQKLDPERINLLYEALYHVYGENKVKKNQHLITQSIKQKCLDKLKRKRKQEKMSHAET